MNYDQPVEMLPLDVLPAEYRHTYQSLSQIAGTRQRVDETSIIRYDPELMHRPVQFIKLIAHELMHARLAGLENEFPGEKRRMNWRLIWAALLPGLACSN